ncbi:MAG TPA: hypothetical protein VGM26_00135 [Rhizomicrobium sp.]|jgi:hypothetical protein
MKKTEEFQSSLAIAIALAIIPIKGIAFGAFALALTGLILHVVWGHFRKQPRWARLTIAAIAFGAVLGLLLPAALAQYS